MLISIDTINIIRYIPFIVHLITSEITYLYMSVIGYCLYELII